VAQLRVPVFKMAPLRREELWKHGQDETVEVNQRALIDSKCSMHAKCLTDILEILARYSGEHTSTLSVIA
jgi:hypothetical protein